MKGKERKGFERRSGAAVDALGDAANQRENKGKICHVSTVTSL